MQPTMEFYLDTTPLKEILKVDSQLRAGSSKFIIGFKHVDSTVVFTPDSESKRIFASDIDDIHGDIFQNCHTASEFRKVLEAHYLVDGMPSLNEAFDNCDYEFSNQNETGSASVIEVI